MLVLQQLNFMCFKLSCMVYAKESTKALPMILPTLFFVLRKYLVAVFFGLNALYRMHDKSYSKLLPLELSLKEFLLLQY